jgi:hypothetical protein
MCVCVCVLKSRHLFLFLCGLCFLNHIITLFSGGMTNTVAQNATTPAPTTLSGSSVTSSGPALMAAANLSGLVSIPQHGDVVNSEGEHWRTEGHPSSPYIVINKLKGQCQD